jgi:hypothetical protein
MRIQYLIIGLIMGIFIGESQAMSPKRTDIPKDQPGHSALEAARMKSGQPMSRELALKYREKYKTTRVEDITEEDIKILREVDKVLGHNKGIKCCKRMGDHWECIKGNGICSRYTDGTTGKLKCVTGSDICR